MGADSAVEALLRAPGAQARAQLLSLAPHRRGRAALHALRPAQRYQLREDASGRALVCVEAPTLEVRIERGRCVAAAEARRAPPGTIFLDGAAECEPFADPVRGVYNLDHHEGCVRAFTLSACEQALVLLLRGLDLRKREWCVQANDADLDAVLAIWVLLNHHRLADGRVRAEILPLLRLEGAIDAHGLALQELCALPPVLLDETRRRMERLRDCERALRATGRWQKVDLLDYTRERLEQIDALVYPQDAFADLLEIEELGRVPLDGGSVALACRAHVGIYEVERQLARFHGQRLGVLVLRQREGVYTVRQLDPALPGGLDALYAHLNRIDPAAQARRAERRWGGSAEIGGSPRAGGSKLGHDEILAACRHVYARPPLVRRLVGGAIAAAMALVAPWAALGAAQTPVWPGAPVGGPAFAGVLALLAACSFALGERRMRGLSGWRRPSGIAWLNALPFAVLGALAGGVWIPTGALSSVAYTALAGLVCTFGAELLFRGFLHARLTASAAPRAPAGSLTAGPVVWSALLYAAATAVLAGLGAIAGSAWGADPRLACAGALLFGLAAGAARESSGSVAAPFALHALSAAALLGSLQLGFTA